MNGNGNGNGKDARRARLSDPAKIAAALRGGAIPGDLTDEGMEIPLGAVARVVLAGERDLGLAPDPARAARRFVVARGASSLCLVEITEGPGELAAASALLDAARALAAREGRPVVPWLVAETVDGAAATALASAGGGASSRSRSR